VRDTISPSPSSPPLSLNEVVSENGDDRSDVGSLWLFVRDGLVWGLLAAEADLGDERECGCMVVEASKAARGVRRGGGRLVADGGTIIESGNARGEQ
jgi:hypothetical protein